MIVITDIEQGSEPWFQEKIGKPSASNMDRIITAQGKPSKQREAYLNRLVAERLINAPIDTYQSQAMLNGIEREAEARGWYEFIHEVEVEQIGVVYQDKKKKYLCSPDGLIARQKGLEIKCPEAHTQVSYLRAGTLPAQYFVQVHTSIFICGFDEWDFFSYFPGLPIFEITIKRNKEFCAKLKVALDEFCDELDQLTERLR